ncbi:MAG TPA: extracellular solute-binding protein, partial [Patescibacteria group bacterium]|nr:extracellular solute-binding protein [Patescibacteria group bacterium]
GPYTVKSFDAGKRIVYARVKDWWAKDLPENKGQYNFDTITYDLYRDETVLLQALFAGEYDFRSENQAKAWYSEYNTVPVKEGWIKKEEIHHRLPAGMQGFVFNTRRAIFKDPLVRKALGYAFDFEWSNKQFAYGSYKRSNSYFDNSELAATGRPQGRELEILEKYRGKIPNEVFVDEFKSPETSGTGADMREQLSTAKRLLNEAGWRIGPGKILIKEGQPLKFEILLSSPMFERWVAPFVANLQKLGVIATVRTVDTTQYQNRTDDFDFDMTVGTFGQSLSPGNEQRDFWASDKVDVKGSRNLIGVKDPIVDELIDLIITAKDREELVAATKALDRVLLWSYYVIPHWHIDYFRIAYWDKFGKPAKTPEYGLGIPETWWFDKERAAVTAQRLQSLKKK